MVKPNIRIHNLQTNEIFDRQMTDSEFEEHQKSIIAGESKINAFVENEEKRRLALAKLEALGLDEDDLKALGL